MPPLSNSSFIQPAPMPSSRRPPDSTSMVAASLARIAGCRKPLARTAVPRRILSVATASAPSAAIGPTWLPRWSGIMKLSNPSSSAFCASLTNRRAPPSSALPSPPAANRNLRNELASELMNSFSCGETPPFQYVNIGGSGTGGTATVQHSTGAGKRALPASTRLVSLFGTFHGSPTTVNPSATKSTVGRGRGGLDPLGGPTGDPLRRGGAGVVYHVRVVHRVDGVVVVLQTSQPASDPVARFQRLRRGVTDSVRRGADLDR